MNTTTDMLRNVCADINALPILAAKGSAERRILKVACHGISCELEEIIRHLEIATPRKEMSP